MDEVQESVIVEANLEALPDDPAAEDVLQAISGYSDNGVNIAMVRTVGGGGPGGGIDFGSNSGDELEILTTDGDIALGASGSISLTTDDGPRVNVNAPAGDVVAEATDDLTLTATGGDVSLSSNNGDVDVSANGDLEMSAGGALVLYSNTLGFYGAFPGVAQQTGVAVDVAAIHAALVNLGLITA